MSQGSDLLLISAVIDATCDEFTKRGLLLSQVTRRLFALTNAGVHEFEQLKNAVLEMDADGDGSDKCRQSSSQSHCSLRV